MYRFQLWCVTCKLAFPFLGTDILTLPWGWGIIKISRSLWCRTCALWKFSSIFITTFDILKILKIVLLLQATRLQSSTKIILTGRLGLKTLAKLMCPCRAVEAYAVGQNSTSKFSLFAFFLPTFSFILALFFIKG